MASGISSAGPVELIDQFIGEKRSMEIQSVAEIKKDDLFEPVSRTVALKVPLNA
jgi:hypothetical protein